MCLANQKTNQRIYYKLPNSAFWEILKSGIILKTFIHEEQM